MALELAEKSVLAGYGSWNRPGRPADPPMLRVLCSGARRSGHSLTSIGVWGQTPGRSWVTVPAPCDSLQYGDVLILITIATRELTVSRRKGTFWTFNKSQGLIVATGCCYKGANSWYRSASVIKHCVNNLYLWYAESSASHVLFDSAVLTFPGKRPWEGTQTSVGKVAVRVGQGGSVRGWNGVKGPLLAGEPEPHSRLTLEGPLD